MIDFTYDEKVVSEFNGKRIIYGIMLSKRPSNTVLLIKKGQDKEEIVDEEDIEKSVSGYKNKYLKMARYYRDERDITVMVATNPFDGFDSISDAVDVIGDYFDKNKIPKEKRSIFAFGHSYGATELAMYAKHYSEITDVILVNMPIVQQFENSIKDGLMILNERGNLVIIYGDDDNNYLNGSDERLEESVDNLDIIVADGADHNFSQHADMFERIPDLFWK